VCSGDYKEVCVHRAKGIFSKVDLDFKAEEYKYRIDGKGYPEACLIGADDKYVGLHRLVCGLKKGDGKFVDHIYHDILDNRRSRLEVTDRNNNARNCIKHATLTGRHGIEQRANGRYRVRVTTTKRKTVGTYATLAAAQEAHAAANKALYNHATVNN